MQPSMQVSGECWIYNIYFKEFEGMELPKALPVSNSTCCDTLTFSKDSVLLQKNGNTAKSFQFQTLTGKYLNDYLILRNQDGEILNINPGIGGSLGQKSTKNKVYLSIVGDP